MSTRLNKRLIGKSVRRKEGRKKVTGQALYVDDLSFPGMLHGATVRSFIPRGRIKNISFEGEIPWDEFVIVTANSKNITKAKPLHHLQMPAGAGLTVSSSRPMIQNMRGRIELLRSSRSRSLSIGDHSWTDPLRKTTTTPAKPASATAICAAMPRASPGSMIR